MEPELHRSPQSLNVTHGPTALAPLSQSQAQPEPEPEPKRELLPNAALCSWYFVSHGRRYVVPYHHTYRANVRARWVGRTLVEAFDDEFPFQAPGFHHKAQAMGQLTATSRNGKLIAPTQALRLGDTVSHVIHTHEPSVREPAVVVIAEDRDVVVVCKSSSLPVHPCGRFRRNTVVQLLAACCGFEGLRAVHRLDRVTSGVVVLARTKAVAHRFSLAIQGKSSTPSADDSSTPVSIRKEYFALVVGAFPSPPHAASSSYEAELVCKASLAVDPVTKHVHVPRNQNSNLDHHNQEQEDDQNGEEEVPPECRPAQAATTRFSCLGHTTWSAVHRHTAGWAGTAGTIDGVAIDGSTVVSLVHCVPETGRTHQIRVHLQHLGFPIVDDPVYGPVTPLPDRLLRQNEQIDSEVPQLQRHQQDTVEPEWGLDEGCPHCPHLEPVSLHGSGGQHDTRPTQIGTTQAKADAICLHSHAYSCQPHWSYVCPLKLTPPWAIAALTNDGESPHRGEEIFAFLNDQRV